MTSAQLPDRGIIFWPVGSGDSTTIVLDDRHVVQVDLHDMAMADEEDAVVAAVVDRLVDVLPKTEDDKPYLAAFILTHADKDHCLGFADLLTKVVIGELWATPRLWREFTEDDVALCDDAEAFHQEAKRRVEATMTAAQGGGTPASGDRIRVVGYDTESSDHAYSELPDEYLSYPGHAVSTIDGDDVSDCFEAFIHAPFKDDCAAERNETSLALQVTLKDGADEGHVLLLGDLAYATITKIFDYSEDRGRPERLAWEVLLAPHHCSKKVMYAVEEGQEVLKDDILDALDRHGADSAVVVVSSCVFPDTNKSGDNPPHVIARERYEELRGDVVCTGGYPDLEAPRPIVFIVGDTGLELVEVEKSTSASASVAKSAAFGLVSAGAATVLVRLAQTFAERRRAAHSRPATPKSPGLDRVARAVEIDRGDRAAPQQPVGFGRR